MTNLPYLNVMSIEQLTNLKNNTKCLLLKPNTNKKIEVLFQRIPNSDKIAVCTLPKDKTLLMAKRILSKLLSLISLKYYDMTYDVKFIRVGYNTGIFFTEIELFHILRDGIYGIN